MGREVRKVSKDWEHPKRNGTFVPLEDDFKKDILQWIKHKILFDNGRRQKDGESEFVTVPLEEHVRLMTFSEYYGECPREDGYMPRWYDENRTHYQMYETCSEGTPISPVMETPEELARWLADNNASSFGNRTATYEQWLNLIRIGWAPSAVLTEEDGLRSGVEATDKLLKHTE